MPMIAPAIVARSLRLLLACLVLTALSGCGDETFMTNIYRYRLSMTFQVDDRQVTASTVQEVGVEELPAWMLAQVRRNSYVRGNALAVDLGALGSLVVLPYSGNVVPISCTRELRSSAPIDGQTAAQSSSCDLEESTLWRNPRYLRGLAFDVPLPPVDMDKKNQPNAPLGFVVMEREQISQVFQGRVRLLRAWFEPTDDPVTTDIATRVVWTRPLVDGTVRYMNVPIRGSSFSFVSRRQLAQDTFHP